MGRQIRNSNIKDFQIATALPVEVWSLVYGPVGTVSSYHYTRVSVPYLQQQYEVTVLDVHCDVKRSLVELAEGVRVGAVLQQHLGHLVMGVLRRPVQGGHLQHVFGVDVRAALRGQGGFELHSHNSLLPWHWHSTASLKRQLAVIYGSRLECLKPILLMEL